MTFAVAVPYALLTLFGAALVVAAFNAKHLILWEDRALTSLANAVRDYRETLEEEQRLLQGEVPVFEAEPVSARDVRDDIRAA